MSLINEALKKAQRSRHGGAAPDGTDAGDGHATRRDQRKNPKSMLLLVAGAVVLVVLSMVLTALWLTRSTPSRDVVATKAAPPAAPSATTVSAEKSPSLVVPRITSPAPTPVVKAPAAAKMATAGEAGPINALGVPSNAASSSAPTSDAVSVLPPTPAGPDTTVTKSETAPVKPNPEVQKFIDAIRVTGIRSSGNESKVLMNDRVYRVNDIVDHTLGIKLTKVSSDGLTFTDQNGAVYVKYF